jgi:hypothetical protein
VARVRLRKPKRRRPVAKAAGSAGKVKSRVITHTVREVHAFGQPAGIRRLRTGGYPKRTAAGWVLVGYRDNKEIVLGHGFQRGCTRLRPNAPGAWIDSKRCTYNFKIADAAGGKWYSCRGYGEGIAVSCRRMKSAPRR